MSPESNGEHEQAARAWRNAKDPTTAWKRFRAYVARIAAGEDDDGDVPYWSLALQCSETWIGPNASGLLIFQKRHVMNAFLGPGPTSRAETLRVAVYQAPFAPRAFDTQLLRAIAKLVGGPPLGFVGDLSPYGLHIFGALRSGDLSAPRLDARASLNLRWLGIDDSWLRRISSERSYWSRRISMGWIEREYWGITKRLMPGVRELVGENSFALLEDGFTLGSDAFNDVLWAELKARLRRMAVDPSAHRTRTAKQKPATL